MRPDQFVWLSAPTLSVGGRRRKEEEEKKKKKKKSAQTPLQETTESLHLSLANSGRTRQVWAPK